MKLLRCTIRPLLHDDVTNGVSIEVLHNQQDLAVT